MVVDVGESILKNSGYKVISAKSGKEAIEVFREEQDRIDMVILDMILPDMGGADNYDRLKDYPRPNPSNVHDQTLLGTFLPRYGD